jgi:6-pyruvoyltetrahydropterin/6-carboxytetrahydropterin synthase
VRQTLALPRGQVIGHWSLVIGHWSLVIGHWRLVIYNAIIQSLESVETAVFRVTREIDFCYGHRLLNHDGKCRHLHGHNGRVAITLESDRLDHRGMVLDFSDIKKVVGTWVDDNLDHQMLLHRDDPIVPILKELGEPMYLLDANPTAENIAKVIHDFAQQYGLPVIETRLWETPNCCATYTGERNRIDT